MQKRKIYILLMFPNYDSNREKQVIIKMTPNGEGWHHLAVKKVSALLIGMTSKHKGDFHCLNCL